MRKMVRLMINDNRRADVKQLGVMPFIDMPRIGERLLLRSRELLRKPDDPAVPFIVEDIFHEVDLDEPEGETDVSVWLRMADPEDPPTYCTCDHEPQPDPRERTRCNDCGDLLRAYAPLPCECADKFPQGGHDRDCPNY